MTQNQNWIQEAINNFNRVKSGQDNLVDRGNAALGDSQNPLMSAVRAILSTGTGMWQGGQHIGSGLGKMVSAQNMMQPVDLTQYDPKMQYAKNKAQLGNMGEMATGAIEAAPALSALGGGLAPLATAETTATPQAQEIAQQIASNPRLRNALGQYMAKGAQQGQHAVNVANRAGAMDIISQFKLPNLF